MRVVERGVHDFSDVDVELDLKLFDDFKRLLEALTEVHLSYLS